MGITGWVILSLFLLSIIVSALIAYFSFKRSLPKIWYRGVGIVYEPNSIQPWRGLEEIIDVLYDVLHTYYSVEVVEKIMRIWIKVVPFDGTVSGIFLPTGRMGDKTANGTVDGFSAFLGLYQRKIVVARQFLDSSGVVRPAKISAIVHEIAEHVVPYVTEGDWNFDPENYADANPKWKALAEEINSSLS